MVKSGTLHLVVLQVQQLNGTIFRTGLKSLDNREIKANVHCDLHSLKRVIPGPLHRAQYLGSCRRAETLRVERSSRFLPTGGEKRTDQRFSCALSMRNVLDNFQTEEDLTSELAQYKHLALAQFRINNEEAKVLAVNRTAPTTRTNKICMYCKTRNVSSNDISL